MTAEEMFNKLGYTLVSLSNELPKYENGDLWVEFRKDKTVQLGEWENIHGIRDYELFPAINKQIEELGWND